MTFTWTARGASLNIRRFGEIPLRGPVQRIRLLVGIVCVAIPAAPRFAFGQTIPESEAFRQALDLAEAKDFDGALTALHELTEAHPQNPLYWFDFGTVSFNLDHYEDALAAFQRVVRLKSPLSPGAWLCSAKADRLLGRFEDAQLALRQAQTLDTAHELGSTWDDEVGKLSKALVDAGVRAIDAGNWDLAESSIQRARRISNTPYATYALALLRLAEGKRGESHELLAQSLSPGDEGAEMEAFVEDAHYLLDHWDSHVDTRPLWLWLDESVGYDSNVFLDGISESGTAEPIAMTGVGAGYATRDPSHYTRINYQLDWEEPWELPSGRWIAQDLRAELGGQWSGWSAYVAPGVQYQIFGTSPYVLRPTAELAIQRRIDDLAVGVLYDYGYNHPLSSDFEYLQGNLHWLVPHLDWVGASVAIGAFYTLLWENTQDLVTSYALLPLRDFAQGPGVHVWWAPDDAVECTLSAQFLFRDYSALAEPGNIARSDQQFLSSLKIGYAVSKSFSPFVSLSWITNQSTLDASSGISDRNYTQAVVTGGISWKILN